MFRGYKTEVKLLLRIKDSNRIKVIKYSLFCSIFLNLKLQSTPFLLLLSRPVLCVIIPRSIPPDCKKNSRKNVAGCEGLKAVCGVRGTAQTGVEQPLLHGPDRLRIPVRGGPGRRYWHHCRLEGVS